MMNNYCVPEITKNQIENMGITVYGFDFCQGPDPILRWVCIGYNPGISGLDYECYMGEFPDGTAYIIAEGYRVPREWIEKGIDFYNDYDKATKKYCNERYGVIL